MDISLVIATLNRHEYLTELLINVSKQTVLPYEILIMEQGRDVLDKSIFPCNLSHVIRIVKLEVKSVSCARYKGMLESKCEIVAFFDDDIIVPIDYLENALKHFKNNSRCNGVGGIYNNIPSTDKNSLMTSVGQAFGIYSSGKANKILSSGWGDFVRGKYAEKETPAEWLFGCNMVYRKEIFDYIDFPYEMLAWSFLEDLYIGNEITKKYGVSMNILPELAVYHKLGTSSGSPSIIVCRMRILHRYYIWSNLKDDKGFYCKFRFSIGLIANLLLDVKNYDFYDCVVEHYKSWIFISKRKNITMKEINEYVFQKN